MVSEGAPGDGLDQCGQGQVIGAGVGVLGAGRAERPHVVQVAEALRRAGAVGLEAVGDLESGRFGYAGGLVEQVADRDLGRVRATAEPEVREVVDDGVVQAEPSVLDEGHHTGRGDRLGDRAPQERGVGRDALAVTVGSPGPLVDRAVGADHGVGHARRARDPHPVADVGIDRGVPIGLHRGGSRDGRRAQQQAEQHNHRTRRGVR
jgi:hypothetical protein